MVEECLIVAAVGGGGIMSDSYCCWWWWRNVWYLLLLVVEEECLVLTAIGGCGGQSGAVLQWVLTSVSSLQIAYESPHSNIYWNSISGQRCSSLFKQQLGRFVEVFLAHKHSFSQSHSSSCWNDRQFLVINKHAEPVLEKAGVKNTKSACRPLASIF